MTTPNSRTVCCTTASVRAGDVGVEEAIEGAADAVVVERGSARGQPEQLGNVPAAHSPMP